MRIIFFSGKQVSFVVKLILTEPVFNLLSLVSSTEMTFIPQIGGKWFFPDNVFKALTSFSLSLIRELSDVDRDGALTFSEFCTAFHLIVARKNGYPLPESLPPALQPAPVQREEGAAETPQVREAASDEGRRWGLLCSDLGAKPLTSLCAEPQASDRV